MSDRKLALTFQFRGIDGLTNPLKNIIGAAGGAQNRLRGLNGTLKDQKKELEALNKTIGAAGVPTRAMVSEQQRLQSAMAATTKKIDAQKDAISRVARADSMSSSAKGKGTENLAVGAAMAAPLFLAAKAAASFEDGMIDIRQKAGLSADETKRLENNIIRAAKVARQLPENMRQGVDTLAGFGMTPKQAGMMIAPIGRAATAYRAEIADLSAASYANFDNLKVPIADTARALDAMAAAGKAGAFEMKDMATYFPAITAQAQALGQGGVSAVADLSAALQIARKGAGDAASAATNIQNLMAKINTEETEKKFAKFGIDLPKALKKAYAEGKTPLEAIAELTNQATKGDLSQVSKLFGDMQAQQALRPLIQNIGEYRKIREEAMRAKGAVDADFAMRSESAGTQARALMGDLSRVALVVGAAVLPAFGEMAKHLSRGADAFGNFAAKNPEVVSFLVKTVALIAGLNFALGGARLAFGMVVGPMAHAYNAFTAISKLGPVVFQAFGLMRTAALFLARGIMQAGMLMLANPIVLIIAAVVAAVALAGYLIYKNWDKIKEAFGAGLTFLQGLWTSFKSIGGNLMLGLIGGITEKINMVKSLVLGIAGKVAGWFKGVLGIKSPSRVFMGFGGYIADGLAIGMDRSKSPMKSARSMAAGVAGAMIATAPMSSVKPIPTATPITSATAITAPAAQASASAPGRTAVGDFSGKIEIHIHAAPGQSVQDIGAEVERRMNEFFKREQARSRSAYRDDDV